MAGSEKGQLYPCWFLHLERCFWKLCSLAPRVQRQPAPAVTALSRRDSPGDAEPGCQVFVGETHQWLSVIGGLRRGLGSVWQARVTRAEFEGSAKPCNGASWE